MSVTGRSLLRSSIIAISIAAQTSSLLPAFGAGAAAGAPEPEPTKLAYDVSLRPPSMTPGAIEAAKLLNILPKVERLIELNQQRTSDAMSDEELALKVDIMDRTLKGAMEVRVVADRIDRELSWAFNSQGGMLAKRQKILNFLFAANFLQGGTLGVLSGPMFLHGNPRAGTELLLLGSSIGLGLSFVSFYEARTGSRKIDSETTVLAEVYDLPHPDWLHQPDVVYRFMKSVPPGSTDNKTRVQALIDKWKQQHRLRSTEEKNLVKLAAVEPAASKYHETIRLVGDRIRMLFDTQYTVEQLDGEFLDLLRATDVN